MKVNPAFSEQVQDVIDKVISNRLRRVYKPLNPHESFLMRGYHAAQVIASNIPLVGSNEANIRNGRGTLISHGYIRVVVGDYGAFIEMLPTQVVMDNIEDRWPDKQSLNPSYLWHVTKDVNRTKIYLQKRTVRYADYRPGLWYVRPSDVFLTRV